MSEPHGIARTRRVVLMAGILALIASVQLMALHLGSGEHSGLEDPDHQCPLCRALNGNPPLDMTLPDLPVLSASDFVDDAAAQASCRAAHRLPRGRAPPAEVHVT